MNGKNKENNAVNIGQEMKDRVKRANVKIEESPDKLLLDMLVAGSLIMLKTDDSSTLSGIVATAYKLGLTAQRDTILE